MLDHWDRRRTVIYQDVVWVEILTSIINQRLPHVMFNVAS